MKNHIQTTLYRVLALAPLLLSNYVLAADISTQENAGEIDINIQYANGEICVLDTGCTIDLQANDETAVNGKDYIFNAITLRWNQGQSQASNNTNVQIIDNLVADGNRIFVINTSNAIGIEPAFDSIEIEIIDDETDASSQPQLEIRRIITNVCPNLSVDTANTEQLLKRDCDALVNAIDSNDPNAQSAIASVTPDQAHAPITASISGSGVQQKNIGKRISSLRSGNHSIFKNFSFSLQNTSLSIEELLLSNTNDDQKTSVDNRNNGQKMGFFVIGELTVGNKDDTDNEDGFELNSNGVSIGFDYKTSSSTTIGTAVGISNSNSEFTEESGELEANGLSLTVFGTYFTNNLLYFDFGMGAGTTDFDQTRLVFYELGDGTSVDQKFFSNFKSNQKSMFISSGKSFSHKGITYTPNFKAEYIRTEVNAYEEERVSNPDSSGAGWLVELDRQSYESLLVGAGIRVEGSFSQTWGVWSPHLGIELLLDSTSGADEVEGKFVGDSQNNSFSLHTDKSDTSYVIINVGSSFAFANGKSSFININTVGGLDNYSVTGLSLGFRWNY